MYTRCLFSDTGGFCGLHRRIGRFHRTRGANWFRSYCSVTVVANKLQLTVYPLRMLCCEVLKMEVDERRAIRFRGLELKSN